MTLDLAADAAAFFADFAEPVTLLIGSVERDVQAIVDRDLPEPIPESGDLVLSAVMEFQNDDTDGLAASEFTDDGTIQVRYPFRVGDATTVDRPVKRLLAQDAGILRVGVL